MLCSSSQGNFPPPPHSFNYSTHMCKDTVLSKAYSMAYVTDYQPHSPIITVKNNTQIEIFLLTAACAIPSVTLPSHQTKPLLNPQCSANTVPFQYYQLSINKLHGFTSVSSMSAKCMKHKDHFLMNKPKHLKNGICKISPHKCTFNTESLY